MYDEEGCVLRKLAVVVLAFAFAALFAYRLAATDPSWGTQAPQNETASNRQ